MVTDFQNTQVLLLAAVLLIACLAKVAFRAPVAANDHVHGVPLPAGLRRATALRQSRRLNVGLGIAEGVLAVSLLVSSHGAVRVITMVAFAVATWAVSEMRAHRPDAGCGCFGGLSANHVGRRSVARAMLFTAAAAASIGAPDAGLVVLLSGSAQVGLVLAVELALFAVLSPELAVLFGRRHTRPPVPCARRRSPLAETYATLRDSEVWGIYENAVTSAVPVDVWREGCWRFMVFPARVEDRDVEVVFAVSTAERDREVRSAVVESEQPSKPPAHVLA